jgi:uncharacterized protein GlcG (DUF336 family)
MQRIENHFTRARRRMNLRGRVAAAMVAAAIPSGIFAQGLPARKTLTFDTAQMIAKEALATCRAEGYKVSIRVVDADNVVRVILRDDDAFPSSEAVTILKASTVILTGKDSGPPAAPPSTQTGGAPPLPATAPPGTTYFPGGLAIKVGDQIVGALGISGAPGGDKDAVCGRDALAKVADRLK